MARKKFIVNGRCYPSENKAYVEVRRLREEYKARGDGGSRGRSVRVFLEEDGHRYIYEDLDFRNE